MRRAARLWRVKEVMTSVMRELEGYTLLRKRAG